MVQHDPHDLEGQRKALKDAEAKRKRDAEVDREDIKWLLSTKRGRRLVWRQMLAPCGIYRLSYTGNSDTYFREGQRSIGLATVARIHETCPDLYHLMQQEQQEHGRDADDGTR